MSSIPEREPGWSTKLFYGAGSIALGIKDQGFNGLLMVYYNQVLGLPAALVGLAVMIALAADALLDPIIGYVSDRTRSRLGRRHPFMYAAALPLALSYVALWIPPHGLSQGALFAYLIVMVIVVRTCVTLHEIPNSALVTDLSSDYVMRTSLMAYRFFLGWWGALVMVVVTFAVLFRPAADGTPGQLHAAGYHHYGIVAAIVMAATILLSATGTRQYARSSLSLPRGPRVSFAARLGEVRRSLLTRSFLAVAGCGMFGAMLAGVSASLAIYFQTYFWHLSGDQIATMILGAFPGALLALLLAPRLAQRFEKRTIALTLGAAGFLIAITPFPLVFAGAFPAPGTTALVVALFTVFTVQTTLSITTSIIVGSMIADVADANELRTGLRTEGLYFSANSFIQKSISGAGLFLSGLILSAVAFPRGAKPGAVAPVVVDHLIVLSLSVMAGLWALSFLALLSYRITRASHAETLRQLGARRAVAPDERDGAGSPAVPPGDAVVQPI